MKKKMLIIISLFVIIVCSSIGALSYFIKNDKIDHELSQSISGTNNVTINTVNDFYKQISLYGSDYSISTDSNGNTNIESSGDYNSTLENISKENRKTLVLNIDIKLHSDALITRDCHINLNGHYIDLGGYQLKVKHQFAGTMSIFNGTIKDSTIVSSTVNSIIYDCPNGHLITKNVTLENSTVEFVNVSTDLLLNSAMNFIVANISNNSIYKMYSFVDQIEITKSLNCEFSDSTDTNCVGCIYTYTDLDFIYNYFSYTDLKISYSSSDTSILSNEGRITKTTTNKDVVLTITLEYNGTKLIKLVNVHVVIESSYAQASLMTLLNYLQKYYDTTESKYVFGDAFLMPLKDTYFKTEYDFSLNAIGGSTITTDMTDYFDKEIYPDNAVVYLNSTITSINISATYTPSSGSSITASKVEVPVIGDSNKLIDDNYSYALAIVQAEIGNQIIVTEDTSTPSGYTEKLVKIDSSEFSKLDPNVDIKYELKYNDTDLTYEITTTKPVIQNYTYDYDDNVYDLLRVSENRQKDPYLNQGVYLYVTLTFKKEVGEETPEVITIPVPIIYEPKMDGNLFDPFDPYYVYFDSEFNSVTNNFTYHSFEIPLFYDNKFPTYTFVVYEEVIANDGNITYELVNYKPVKDANGNTTSYEYIDNGLFTITITYDNGTTFTTIDNLSELNNILESHRINNNSVTSIVINPYLVDFDTKTYKFVYVPIFKNDKGTLQYSLMKTNKDTNGTITYTYKYETTMSKVVEFFDLEGITDYKYISTLTIPGLARYQKTGKSVIEEVFYDSVFYKYIFDILHPEETYVDGKTFIYSSRLGNVITTANTTTVTKPVVTEDKDGNEVVIREEIAKINNVVNINQITGIKSLKGIEYLSGLRALTLEGYDVMSMTEGAFSYTDTSGTLHNVAATDWLAQIEYISQMQGLEYLNLANTGISDSPDTVTTGMPGDDNGFLETLSNLTSLKYLYLNDNNIYRFNALQNFPSLEYVNVKGNDFTIERGDGIINIILEFIFNLIVNAIYGTQGATNQAVYSILISQGVFVEADAPLDVMPETQAIIDALISLEYQDKLKNGISIENIYSSFPKTGPEYGLTTQYTQTIDDTQVRYTISRVYFSYDGTNPTTAKSFTFHIEYTWEYYANWWTGWETTDPDANGNPTNIIDYYYTYNVTRYN